PSGVTCGRGVLTRHPALDGNHQACHYKRARRGKGSFVTETTTGENTAPEPAEKPRRSGALSAMRPAQLQQLPSSMDITRTAKMRKSDLIAAIREQQSGSSASARTSAKKSDAAPADKTADKAESRTDAPRSAVKRATESAETSTQTSADDGNKDGNKDGEKP